MKAFIASTLFATSFVASSAHALFASTDDHSRFYIGGLYGTSSPSESMFDDDKSMRLGFGFALNDRLAIEINHVDLGAYAMNDRDFLASVAMAAEREAFEQTGEDVRIDSIAMASATTGLEVSLVGEYPLSDLFSVYGRVGLFNWAADLETDIHFSWNGMRERFQDKEKYDDGLDTVFGLGAAYRIIPALSLNIEWSNYTTSDMDNRVIGIGARWHF